MAYHLEISQVQDDSRAPPILRRNLDNRNNNIHHSNTHRSSNIRRNNHIPIPVRMIHISNHRHIPTTQNEILLVQASLLRWSSSYLLQVLRTPKGLPIPKALPFLP